jgi:hypothetical protein
MNSIRLSVCLYARRNSKRFQQIVRSEILTVTSGKMAVLCVLLPVYWYTGIYGSTWHKMKILG